MKATSKPTHHSVATLLALALLSMNCLASLGGPPSGYQLEWSDEFNGTEFSSTELDPTKWSHRQLGPRHDAVNVEDSVSLNDGILTITTFTENGTHYTGMIGTENKYMPLYGYMEAMINFNDSPGMWSAFWMQSPTVTLIGDPHNNGTEMDVVEHRAHDASDNDISNQAVSNIHWDGYGASHRSVGSGLRGAGLATGWHTYAVEWTPDVQNYFMDGVYLWSVTNALEQDPAPPAAPVSHRTEYFILSSEVKDGSWAGTIPSGGYGTLGNSTTKMNVEYVRVYKFDPYSVPPPPVGLAATPQTYQIGLSWAPTVSATSYKVKRASSSGGPYTTIFTPTAASCTDTSVYPGTTYYYVVSALNAMGEGADSAELAVTSQLPPGGPPSDDAYVRNGSYANNNYGGATTMEAKLDAASYSRESFLKFDVTGLANAGQVVIQMTPTTVGAVNPNVSFEFVSDDSWAESSLTWNNKPAGSGTVITNLSGFVSGTPVSIDVTGLARSEAAGDGTLSVRVYSNTYGSTAFVRFGTKENGTAFNRPELVVSP
jgi:beta-glucanase (GH16 family)